MSAYSRVLLFLDLCSMIAYASFANKSDWDPDFAGIYKMYEQFRQDYHEALNNIYEEDYRSNLKEESESDNEIIAECEMLDSENALNCKRANEKPELRIGLNISKRSIRYEQPEDIKKMCLAQDGFDDEFKRKHMLQLIQRNEQIVDVYHKLKIRNIDISQGLLKTLEENISDLINAEADTIYDLLVKLGDTNLILLGIYNSLNKHPEFKVWLEKKFSGDFIPIGL